MKNNRNKVLIAITVIFLPFIISYIPYSAGYIDAHIGYIVSSIQILCLVFLFTRTNTEKP